MRKRLLWLIALAPLLAPLWALFARMGEQRTATQELAAGLSQLDSTLERTVDLATIDAVRARGHLERAWRADPAGTTGRRARALWHVAQGYADIARNELVMAQQEVDTAGSLLARDPHVRLAQATVALRRNDRLRAERMLEELANARPDRVHRNIAGRAALLRLELLLDQNRANDALQAAEALDREHPRVARVANLLGLARSSAGDRVGARDAFQRAITLDPRSETALVNLARLDREAGDLANARQTLERALAIAPQSAEAWLAYGVVLSDLQAPAARHALVRASELSPEDATALVAQGNLDLRDNNFSGAIESFRAALTRDPAHATAQTNLGIALFRNGEVDAALRVFEDATRRSPHQGEAWNGLGVLRMQRHEWLGAIGPLQQASVLLPQDPNPAVNLGLAYEGLERWNDAARAYREALRRAPEHPLATAHLLRIVPPDQRERVQQRLRIPGPLASR